LQDAVKFSLVDFRRELSHTPPTVCIIIISKIALKEDFMAFGRALPNHVSQAKNVTVRYHVFYNLCLVQWFLTFCLPRPPKQSSFVSRPLTLNKL